MSDLEDDGDWKTCDCGGELEQCALCGEFYCPMCEGFHVCAAIEITGSGV